ncbi:hypothetical protein BSLG_002480 [Batrachochytrium salamandrivorans]|nr:hypothetical protein BSLG_002480 [Batrachochytrium salamandrivorans]
MNRANEARIRENLKNEQHIQDSKSAWVLSTVDTSGFTSGIQHEQESSYLLFMDAPSMARKSFNSFNKDLEKLSGEFEKEERLKRAEENERREQITDKDMVGRYNEFVNTETSSRSGTGAQKRKRGHGKVADGTKNRAIVIDDDGNSASNVIVIDDDTPRPVDWSKERGRKATRFAAGQFIKPLE